MRTMQTPAAVLSQAATELSKQVLLLEDDEALNDLFEHILHSLGCSVSRFRCAEEADAATGEGLQGVLVSDLWLAGRMSGIGLLKRLRARGDDRPFLLISGSCGEDVQRAAFEQGAHAFLQKPFSMSAFGQAVQSMLAACAKPQLSLEYSH